MKCNWNISRDLYDRLIWAINTSDTLPEWKQETKRQLKEFVKED